MAESGTLMIDGARIGYTDFGGDGPVVLHLHGLSSCREYEAASGLIDPVPFAEAGLRLVAFDARGHGESSGRPAPADYEWGNLGEDLLAIADRFSPSAPVHAVGVSMGTATILHAATRRPARLRSIVLGAPPTAWATRADQAAVYEELARTVEADPAQAATFMDHMPVPEIFAELAAERAEQPEPAVRAGLLPSVLRGAGASDLPDPAAVAEIAVPTLILAWAGDPGHPVSTAERLAESVPGAELRVSQTAADVGLWPQLAAEFFATR